MAKTIKTDSKLGIVACLLAFAVWIYFAAAVYLFFFVDGFTQRVNDFLVPPSDRIADLRGLGIMIVVFAVVFLVIPAAGHLIGLVMSLVGMVLSKNKRLFPILGLFLNALPMVILLTLYVIGAFAPPS